LTPPSTRKAECWSAMTMAASHWLRGTAGNDYCEECNARR
jgi:hypothetical protein